MNQIGIDISNDVFDATLQHSGGVSRRQFSNTKSGHRQFQKWALRRANSAQVCMEATGVYHLQLALALDANAAVELMVVNPCAARRFAQANMVRAKTDAIDADGLLLFLQRMPFRCWLAPRQQVLQLQSLAHRVSQLDKEITRERSRLHAVRRAGSHTRLVQQDIQAHLIQLKRRLDPRPGKSGSSVRSPRRISKQGNARIRAALYMPALVAKQHDPNVKAYYEKLLAAGKPKMQAIVAVMRKLLHALWGMLHHRQEWDGQKFYRLNQVESV